MPSRSSAASTRLSAFLVDKIAKNTLKPVEDSKAIAQVAAISAGNDE
jgi:chaperonin GroEL